MAALDRTVWPEHAIVHHGRNDTGGRDLVAGDIHGHFDTLEHALDKLGFNPGADRLFAVGDLVDRGPQSGAALEWLAADRIAAVRGNHDQAMVDALLLDHGKRYPSGHSELWAQIGGQWWYDLPDDSEEAIAQRRQQWLTALRRVPFARTLETFNGQRIGIVHTLELANDWSSLEATLKDLAHEARDQCPERTRVSHTQPPAARDPLGATADRMRSTRRHGAAGADARDRPGADRTHAGPRSAMDPTQRALHRHRRPHPRAWTPDHRRSADRTTTTASLRAVTVLRCPIS